MKHTSNTKDSDPRLTDLRAGSERAFEAVYREHRVALYGFLLRLAADEYVAQDLFQNVWLKLARFAKRLRPGTELKAWLFTVARNEYIDYRRAQTLDLSRLLVWGRHTASIAAGPLQTGEAREIELALLGLPDRDRETLLLGVERGLSHGEAAAVLGVTPAAWRQRLSRARRRFAQNLENQRQARPGTPALAPAASKGVR